MKQTCAVRFSARQEPLKKVRLPLGLPTVTKTIFFLLVSTYFLHSRTNRRCIPLCVFLIFISKPLYPHLFRKGLFVLFSIAYFRLMDIENGGYVFLGFTQLDLSIPLKFSRKQKKIFIQNF